LSKNPFFDNRRRKDIGSAEPLAVRLLRSEFPEALKFNNFYRPDQQDSPCPVKILCTAKDDEGDFLTV
jgi:hypothetical protein